MPSSHHTIPSLTPKDIARFWIKVDKSPGFGPNGDCWRWTACRGNGYGVFGLTERKGLAINSRAHRISWMLAHGAIPQGMNVCHHCDEPGCVNPDHLFLETAAGNTADMTRKGRQAKGADNGTAKITDEIAVAIRQRFALGDLTQIELGRQYGLAGPTISKIVLGDAWQHVGGPVVRRRKHHRLSLSEVLAIRRRYAAGGLKQAELAREYGVDRGQISRIVNRLSHAKLEAPPTFSRRRKIQCQSVHPGPAFSSRSGEVRGWR